MGDASPSRRQKPFGVGRASVQRKAPAEDGEEADGATSGKSTKERKAMNKKQKALESKPVLRLWVNVAKIFASEVYSVRSGFSDKTMAEKHCAEGEVTIEVVESPKD